MSKYRVLSFDGGGVRGIITVRLMQRLAEMPDLKNWYNQAKFYAGTSTGGLIALGLANGMRLETIYNLYYDKSEVIFDDSWYDDVRDVGQVLGAQYSSENLEKELIKKFGADLTLSQLGKRVLITSFDLDESDATSMKFDPPPDEGKPAPQMWKPKIFHNFPGKDQDRKVPVYKVGMYTTAAPSYFPVAEGYVDGGVFAVNPSMCAVAQTQDDRNKVAEDRPALNEVVLLSLGTGQAPKFISGANLDWGYTQWAAPILNILLDGVAGIANFQCKQLLRGNYHRLSPQLVDDFKLDDWKKMDEMLAFADQVDLTADAEWLRTVWLPD